MSDAPGANAGGGADSVSRDFATSLAPAPAPASLQQPEPAASVRSRTSSHVHYTPSIDPDPPSDLPKSPFARDDAEAALSPGLRRRSTRAGTFRSPTRAGTFKTVDDFQDYMTRPGWHRMFDASHLDLYLANLRDLQPVPSQVWTRASLMAAMPPCQH